MHSNYLLYVTLTVSAFPRSNEHTPRSGVCPKSRLQDHAAHRARTPAHSICDSLQIVICQHKAALCCPKVNPPVLDMECLLLNGKRLVPRSHPYIIPVSKISGSSAVCTLTCYQLGICAQTRCLPDCDFCRHSRPDLRILRWAGSWLMCLQLVRITLLFME